jgi:protein-tyrosine phosphatase
MIDLHCHVLPGIDDGPDSIEDSVAFARVAADAGIATLVATPHVNSRTPNDPDTIAGLVGELRARLASEQVDVDIRPGAEIAIDHVSEIPAEQLPRLGLGGGEWLLIEPPFAPVAPGLEGAVLELRRRGHSIVLAHPERCPALRRDRHVVPALVGAGVLVSITAGSVTGRFGSEVRAYALELTRAGLVHNFTSDAHDSVKRPPGIAEALQQAGLERLTDWCTRAVPEAILDGGTIPPMPAGALPAAPATLDRR